MTDLQNQILDKLAAIMEKHPELPFWRVIDRILGQIPLWRRIGFPNDADLLRGLEKLEEE